MDRVIGGRAGAYWRTIALVIGTAILAAVIASIVVKANRNHEAIEKGCILLQNTIVKSQTPMPSTKVLVKALIDNMTPAQRQQYAAAKTHDDPNVLFVNCSKLADHPEDIQAIPLPGSPSAKK